jgi:hypothetical protein
MHGRQERSVVCVCCSRSVFVGVVPVAWMAVGSGASLSLQGVLRSKGFYWLAARYYVMGLRQSAGGAWQGEPR